MKTLNENPSSSNPMPTDKEFYDQEFNTDLQAEMFDNGPETEGERLGDRAMKGAAWLAGIVGLFALAVVIAAAFDLSPTPSPAKATKTRTTALRTNIGTPGSSATDYSSSYASTQPIVLKSITVIAQEPAKFAQNAASAGASATTKTAEKAVSAATPADKASAATGMSKADLDRIEREALEVIHGDYGNNPGRAKKLGADYDLVQARVNQLLHS
ncbi:MAG: hypothetical protein K2J58_07465 [Muribaculaceae bacterium]|nr:hypothetical protein [Muribaculaceae bacterium]